LADYVAPGPEAGSTSPAARTAEPA